MNSVGLVNRSNVVNSFVVRETEAYPTYYLGFQQHYDKVKNRINEFENVVAIGRGGMYKYNNQDHSLYSGILAAKNYVKEPKIPYDLWKINEDAEYHESAIRDEK